MDVRGTFVVNGPHIPVCCLAKGAEVFLARVKIAGDQALLIAICGRRRSGCGRSALGQKRPLDLSSKPSREHPSIVSQAPSWGTKPTTFCRYILIPIEASDPLPATLLERFSESSFGCLVARSLTWNDCDRTDHCARNSCVRRSIRNTAPRLCTLAGSLAKNPSFVVSGKM